MEVGLRFQDSGLVLSSLEIGEACLWGVLVLCTTNGGEI